jgi:EAL domain-containing protein (putative c-di-GMP-specific phosphodiesterase class I)
MARPAAGADSTPKEPLPREIAAIEQVLADGALKIVYQPIFDVRSGRAYGFEVLTRGQDEMFSDAGKMFDVATRSGQVGELGRLQRTEAIKRAPRLPLFVNIHPGEFDHPWLIRPDDPIFRHTEDVYLEITESAPLSYFEQCIHVLGELRKKGMQLAIDDFGAGFSNIKYISDLNPDVVKVDRELITGISEGSRQFRLLESVVRLCKDMGARVVAEGIETPAELVLVQRAGVDLCQGYLLGRPAADPRVEEWPGFEEWPAGEPRQSV